METVPGEKVLPSSVAQRELEHDQVSLLRRRTTSASRGERHFCVSASVVGEILPLHSPPKIAGGPNPAARVVHSIMPSSYSRVSGTKHLVDAHDRPPAHYLVAHIDGGARGNPGPAGYGVVLQDEAGRKVASLSEYLGHQTNNFAEYQGLIGALEYAIEHGPRVLKVVSDSELLVRQIKGIYKVKNATLKDLHARAKELIGQLEWFSISHALREHNREADRLANEAMDKGMRLGKK
jgi:ribonuclease HI